MVDVHEGVPKDGFAVPLRLHNVLLALAGRLDDSALSEARELVARSHLDEAAELAVGALIAGRIQVRPTEQRELGLVLEMSRSDAALADHLTVGESVLGYTHRFSSDGQPQHGVAEALERTLQVLPDLRSVHAVWRNTPAGSVPGPLPQRVVLIEIGPEAHPPAVAFRVDDALRRAGIRTVVEVTGPGVERGEYHEAALAAASPVWLASSGANGTSRRSGGDLPPKPREGARARSRAKTESRGSSHANSEGTNASESEPEPVEIPSARETVPVPERTPEPEPSGGVLPPAPVAADPEPSHPEGPDVASADMASADVAGAVAGESAAEPVPKAAQAPAAEAAPEPAPEPTAPEPEAATGSEHARSSSEQELTSAVTSANEVLAEFENKIAETTEMSKAEVAQLRAAIAEDPEKGRAIAGLSSSSDDVEVPELNLDDPQLSDRDRKLLHELHVELAERERAEAARTRTNGAQHRWSD